MGVPAEAGSKQNAAKCGANEALAADGGCACSSGYTAGDGGCVDIDECDDPSLNDCDPNADCTNHAGGFACKCKGGFEGDGTRCTRQAECSGATNNCDPNATCVESDSGTPCVCNTGYTGSGFSCSDIDECSDPKLFSCAANATCQNTFGSYDCVCAPGYTGDGKTSCQSLCSVALANSSVCDKNGLCRDDGQTATCDACAPGFTGDGKTCTASALCPAQCDGARPDDAPHTICTNGGACACAPGYTGTPGNCADVNECASDGGGGCGTNAVCTNTDGGFVCTCATGFSLDGTGTCVAVNPCDAVPGPCHPDAICTPTEANSAGFTCACKPGFTGDGLTCTDVNECATNNGGCSANATCTNTRGSFTCSCNAPFTGDPSACYCDLTGTWAVREDVSTCWDAIPIAAGTSQNLISQGSLEDTTWELHQISYDGSTMTENAKGCGSDKTPDLVSPLFRETYSSYIPLGEYDMAGIATGTPFAAKALVPGSNYVTPTEAAVLGIKLTGNPITATWPDKWEDVDPSAWQDDDGDGEPGLTLWPRLPSQSTQSGSGKYSYIPAEPGTSGQTLIIVQRAGCVSVALRVIGHFEGQIDTCSHIIGTEITEQVEGRVHSCTLVDKGTCDAQNPDNCTGWQKDITCNQSDWTAATTASRCTSDDLDRLDNDQNQKENSAATFEMVKLGALGTMYNCPDVRTALPPISRPAPMITCTPP